MNVEKLKRLQAQVRIGGKGTPRRKKKVMHQTATTDDKKLQSSLKKLSVSTIPGIEEVNIIKDDLTVIHFNNPKAQASLSANTFAVTGHGETKKIVEMLPDILPQLGQETVVQLRMFANSMSNNQKHDSTMSGAAGTMNILDSVLEEDDVPILVSDFDEVAKAEAAAVPKQPMKPGVDAAEILVDNQVTSNGVAATQQDNRNEISNNISNEIKSEHIQVENNLNAAANTTPKSDQKQKNNKIVNDAKENKKQNKKEKQDTTPADKKDNRKEKDTKGNDKKINEKQTKTQNQAQQQQKVNKKVEVQQVVVENKDNVVAKEKSQEPKLPENAQVPKFVESTQTAKLTDQTTEDKTDQPNAQQASKKSNDNKQQTGKKAKQANNEKKPAANKSNELKSSNISPSAPVINEAVKSPEAQSESLANLSGEQKSEPVAQIESATPLDEQQKEIAPTKQSTQKNSIEPKVEVKLEVKSESNKEDEPKIEENKKIETKEPNKIECEKVVAVTEPNVEAITNEPISVLEKQKEKQTTPITIPELPKEVISEQVVASPPVEVAVEPKKIVLSINAPNSEVPAQETIVSPVPMQQVKVEKTIEEPKIETKTPELISRVENITTTLLDEQISKDNKTNVSKETTGATTKVTPITIIEQTKPLESENKAIEPEVVKVQETEINIKEQPELKDALQKSLQQVTAENALDISIELEAGPIAIKSSEAILASTAQSVDQLATTFTPVESKIEQLIVEAKSEGNQPISAQTPQEEKQVQKVETKSGPTTPTNTSPKQKANQPPKQSANNNKKPQDGNKQQPKNITAAGETTKSTANTDAKKAETMKQKQQPQGKPQPQQQHSTKSTPSATKTQQSPNKSASTTTTTPAKVDKPALSTKPTTPTTPTKPNTPTADTQKKANTQQKQQQGDPFPKGKQQGGGGGAKPRPATAGGNATKSPKPSVADKQDSKTPTTVQAAAAPKSIEESASNAPAAAGK